MDFDKLQKCMQVLKDNQGQLCTQAVLTQWLEGKEVFIATGCKMDSNIDKDSMTFLRSAQSTKPSPLRGGLHSHLSWWLTAEQTAPGAQGFLWHNGRHSFLCDPGG